MPNILFRRYRQNNEIIIIKDHQYCIDGLYLGGFYQIFF